MARYRRPTPSNVTASREIQEQILRRIAELSATATAALKSAANPEIDVVTRRGHLAAARTAEKQIDDATIELAAAVVLGGGRAADVAARSGISTATLTRRMPAYLRALRGGAPGAGRGRSVRLEACGQCFARLRPGVLWRPGALRPQFVRKPIS